MQLSLSSVWPDFSSLAHGFGSSSSISAIFWIFEIAIFAWFIALLVLGYRKSSGNVKFFADALKGIKREELVTNRRSLKERMKKNAICKGIWLEFDETLVVSSNGQQLCNTYDASHFFNTHSLASKIAESRLLAAVPGFLTAIGVIGTFLGLQLGLGALNLNTGDTEQLKGAISSLISSASIAFMTSVWGVLLSLIFNAVEKWLESRIRGKVVALQQCIDKLFPRLIAEQTLLDIRNDGHQAKEALMGLAEQIGERMQVAVQGMADTVTSGMQTSFERIMSPAIKQMVEASTDLAKKQTSSSEDVLKNLIGEFMTGMGQTGAQQQSMMEQASQEMNRSMAEWGSGMNQFLGQLNLTLSRFEDMSQRQNETLADQLNQSLASQKNGAEYMTEKMKSMAGNLMDDVKNHQQQIADAEQARLDHLADQLESSVKRQVEELQKVSNSSQTAAEDFQESMRNGMATLIEDYQARQKSIAESDIQRQRAMGDQITELTSTVNNSFGRLMEQFSNLQQSGVQADIERQTALDAKVTKLTEMVNGSFGQLMQQFGEQQKTTVAADVERQAKMRAGLEDFIELQKTQFSHTLNQASSINDRFAQTIQSRMDVLVAQDQQRDQQIRSQMEEMRTSVALVVENMRNAMDGHLQSVKVVVQQASVLNEAVQRSQAGFNHAAENIVVASQQMEQASVNLHKGQQEVARATESISGTLDLAISAVAEVSQENTLVAKGLQTTLSSLEKLQSSLSDLGGEIRIGSENADSASRELSSNHARYRQEMQEAIGSLHEQLGHLLNGYAKNVQDQTSHRMEEWNRHTQEYVTGMQGVVSVMQELVDDMDSRRAA